MNSFENYKVMGDFLGIYVINLTKGKGKKWTWQTWTKLEVYVLKGHMSRQFYTWSSTKQPEHINSVSLMIADCRYSFLETSIVCIQKPELARKGE